jgi:hypothetical protein
MRSRFQRSPRSTVPAPRPSMAGGSGCDKRAARACGVRAASPRQNLKARARSPASWQLPQGPGEHGLSHDTRQPKLGLHRVVVDRSDDEGRCSGNPKLMAILNVLLDGLATESCGTLIKFLGVDLK